MTTCTWNFLRHARRLTALALGVALGTGLVAPTASADQVSNLRSEAAAIAAKINTLGQQEEALSERYDAAQYQVQTLQAKVHQASVRLASAQSAAARDRAVLKDDAIQAYIDGGSGPLASGTNVVRGANESLLRAEYVNTLATDQTNAIDQYRLASLQEQTAETNLKQQTAAAQAQLQQVDRARAGVQATAAQLTSLQSQVKGKLARAVAAQQAAQLAAQQAAARRAAAEAAAQRQAYQPSSYSIVRQPYGPSGGGSNPPAAVTSYAPPPPGSGASGAVAAAESRLGDWYQWGASGPTTFDCSGLVMWAYAQVGISLPHYSGAQYADTVHIPMSDLQPGDLVFFANPGEHVAMYVGNGEVIEAPHTGAQVHIVPMYSGFVLASRVE